MKKIFTLCISCLMFGFAAQAQEEEEELDETFLFINTKTGEVLDDGAMLTLSELEDKGGVKQISLPIAVQKTFDDDAAGYMICDISEMPNGTFSSCAFGQCTDPWEKAGIYDSWKGLVTDNNVNSIQTEWIPSAYGTWTATLQIVVLDVEVTSLPFPPYYTNSVGSEIIGYGPKISVTFNYVDPASVSSQSAVLAQEVARFDAAGRQLSQPQKGINIVRMSDGTVRKVVVK